MLVVRHFLACCSQPAVGAETTVEIDIAGEQFTASGRVVLAVSILFSYILLLLLPFNWLPIPSILAIYMQSVSIVLHVLVFCLKLLLPLSGTFIE